MPITNGRTDENKKRILRKYRLHPVMHTCLLNGKTVECCCGDTLNVGDTDAQYHQFDAIDLASGKAVDTLYAGQGCAKAFERLSQASGISSITLLPLFNPLQPVQGGGGGGHGQPGNPVPIAPINAEIEQAINLTLICWNSPPRSGGVFSKLLDKIRRFPSQPLSDSEVRSINTAIGPRGGTLTARLAALRAQNPTLRHYVFPAITAVLQSEAVRLGTPINNNLQ